MISTMGVARLDNEGVSYCDNYAIPEPQFQQVRLRVNLAGICATDIALSMGYAKFSGVLGHEFVGHVVDLGAGVEASWHGKRVVAEINQYCSLCDNCLAGRVAHCVNRQVIGIREHQGAFATYIVVNVNTLHLLPDEVDDRLAVFVEPLAAAYRILEQLDAINKSRVLIVGAGKLGQLIARVMVTQAAEVGIVTKNTLQRDLLAELNVACLNVQHVDAGAWDVVIEASGQPSGLELAMRAVRPAGTVVLKSTYLQPLSLDLSALVVNEVCLIGSRCGPFDKAIDALVQGKINPLPLIEDEYSLVQIEEAMAHASRPGAMKILVRP